MRLWRLLEAFCCTTSVCQFTAKFELKLTYLSRLIFRTWTWTKPGDETNNLLDGLKIQLYDVMYQKKNIFIT